MKKIFLSIWCMLAVSLVYAQDTIPVLTLGTFHFDFPNLDRVQYGDDEQINVLEPAYQAEIEALVNSLTAFSPTIIVIERPVGMQDEIDSLFCEYRAGRYVLQRGEYEQVGFRLAKRLGIDRIYCADEWGRHYENIAELLDNQDSDDFARFDESFYNHPDSVKEFTPQSVFNKQGIIAELIALNNPENVRRSLGNYLIGHFKYESSPYDFIGTDFETGRWFNRNLRIFRNIQRIETGSTDRILVIFGAGHLNILNYLFECSPEYRLEDTNKYLKQLIPSEKERLSNHCHYLSTNSLKPTPQPVVSNR